MPSWRLAARPERLLVPLLDILQSIPVWNGMMSFGGGWFFLAASDAISVLNRQYTLPGLSSYVAAAVAVKDLHALAWAIATMIALILLIDQFFWKPLVH